MTEMTGVREYAEEYAVEVKYDRSNERYVVFALNEGGHNSVSIDLLDMMDWLEQNWDTEWEKDV